MKDDTWYDEEARSQIYMEQGQKFYMAYLDNALAFLTNSKLKDGKEPDEPFMRLLENFIDIPEQSAYDFRQSVVTKWANELRKCSVQPRWDHDWAMKDAITKALKHVECKSTIRVLKPQFPEWNFNMEYEQMVTHEQAHRDFQKNNCTCSIDTLMTSGCKCGHLEKK